MLSRSEIMPTSYFGIVSDSHSTNIIICCSRHLSCTSCPMALKQRIKTQSRHKYTRCMSHSFENEISAFILKIKINIQSQLIILSPTFFIHPAFHHTMSKNEFPLKLYLVMDHTAYLSCHPHLSSNICAGWIMVKYQVGTI